MGSFCSLLPYVRQVSEHPVLSVGDSSIEAARSRTSFLPRNNRIHRTWACPVNTCENHVLFPGSFRIPPIPRKQLFHPLFRKARRSAAAKINEGDENKDGPD